MTWEKIKLQNCCLSIADGDHQPPPKAENGIPFITISNFTNTNDIDFTNTMFVPDKYYHQLDSKRKAQSGDILYSVVGSFGIPVLIKEKHAFVFQRHIAILRPDKNKIDPAFLFYTMLNSSFYAKADAVAVGSAQRTISLGALRNIEINLPNLSVQQRIVKVLSAYNELIEVNQKQIRLLEEAARRLYREWFVDLRFPGHEDTPITDGIPAGWSKTHISEICQMVSGGTPSTKVESYYSNGSIPWVTPTDITQNKALFFLDTEKKITEDGLHHSSAKMVPAGTILMTSRASVGYFGMCDFEVCTNQGFISCIPNQSNLQMFLLFNLKNRIGEIRQKAGGSTYLEIRKTTLGTFDILIPSAPILQLFQNITQSIFQKERSLLKTNKLLQEARDRLLPKLMNGEIEV